MEIQLIDLPQVCLEEIFKKLSFAEISQLGRTCKYFREIAKTLFRLYFKNIEHVIEKEMEAIETEATKAEELTVSDHLHLALLHSEPNSLQVLRILLSEAKMLNAHCWRYIRDPKYDFCFPAGLILDEFEKILTSIRNKTLKKDMEPEITTTLFHLGETFYDHFDFRIENSFHESADLKVKITTETNRQSFLPNIYNFIPNVTPDSFLQGIKKHIRKNPVNGKQHLVCEQEGNILSDIDDNSPITSEINLNEKTLFGVKVLDILNCCASSNFHTLLLHNNENNGFKLQTDYELRDINVLEALPTIGVSLTSTSEKQLGKICRYLRNNVRWTNLFHPLQDLWMLEDAIEINRDVETASALLRHWKIQRSSSRLTIDSTPNDLYQYNYRKIISRFKNRFGLIVMASLECPTIRNVPLSVQKSLEATNIRKKTASEGTFASDEKTSQDSIKHSMKHFDVENWDGDIPVYKFHLEMKIQYPSFLSETIKEAILKVDQVGEKTTVTTDGDDMRKCACYRVEDEYSES
ncbi:hypothetical protein RUM43_005929 [Polyplax serrata]|uniref:F-box domain-containing protein n=1 Tax=Polyplax serrata TaxID=468196 RepID=A0AAN8S372_POLSC